MFDCAEYIICFSEQYERRNCPAGKKFDLEYMACMPGENVDCEGRTDNANPFETTEKKDFEYQYVDDSFTLIPVGMSTHLAWQPSANRPTPTRPSRNDNNVGTFIDPN